MSNQKGFGVVRIISVVAIVGLIITAGWLVYDRQKSPKSSNTPAATSTTSQTTAAAKPPAKVDIAEWTAYSSKEGKFSLKYPANWATASNPENCSPSLLLLGADSKSVGKCASESVGQMGVASVDGDQKALYQLTDDGYTGIKTETVTVSGVKGIKQTAIFKNSGIGDLPDGTKVTFYLFYTQNHTYWARYVSGNSAGSYPDVLDDFNTMVTTTLKFQP